jgi:hypothetical protein
MIKGLLVHQDGKNISFGQPWWSTEEEFWKKFFEPIALKTYPEFSQFNMLNYWFVLNRYSFIISSINLRIKRIKFAQKFAYKLLNDNGLDFEILRKKGWR